jgi:hypothetical protein
MLVSFGRLLNVYLLKIVHVHRIRRCPIDYRGRQAKLFAVNKQGIWAKQGWEHQGAKSAGAALLGQSAIERHPGILGTNAV